jgi:hypothetical protein
MKASSYIPAPLVYQKPDHTGFERAVVLVRTHAASTHYDETHMPVFQIRCLQMGQLEDLVGVTRAAYRLQSAMEIVAADIRLCLPCFFFQT